MKFLLQLPRLHGQQVLLSKLLPHKPLFRALLHRRLELFQQLQQLLAKQKAQQDAKVKALVKDQATRLQQLEKANLEALSQNQELQLKNDNLGVQVQVLQSERSAQMFLYGAATLAVGVLLGFLIASYVYTKRRRQW